MIEVNIVEVIVCLFIYVTYFLEEFDDPGSVSGSVEPSSLLLTCLFVGLNKRKVY